VHPKDFEAFQIVIIRDLDELDDVVYKLHHSPEGISTTEFVHSGIYRIVCTVWTDGLEKPKQEILEIEVLDSDAKIINSDAIRDSFYRRA